KSSSPQLFKVAPARPRTASTQAHTEHRSTRDHALTRQPAPAAILATWNGRRSARQTSKERAEAPGALAIDATTTATRPRLMRKACQTKAALTALRGAFS